MFESIKNKDIVLTYFGVYTDEITSNLIALIEVERKRNNHRKKILKRIPMLIAECFQNIIRHGESINELTPESTRDYFQIHIKDNDVLISSSNVVKNTNIESIKTKIDLLNELSKEDLKDMRRTIIREGEFTDKGGASLGLVEMAIRTENNLQFQFHELDKFNSQFFLAIALTEETSNVELMDDVYSEYIELKGKNALLLYKGDVSWSSTSQVIQILERNFLNNQLSTYAVKELSVVIEVLQNSAKHGLKVNGIQEGIIALCLNNTIYSLYCGNYISESNAKILQRNFKKINSSSLDQLNESYKEQILSNELDSDGNAGLGLIEIARQTAKNYIYEIFEDRKNALFLSLEVELN